ncbi:transglycosylase SLT domain-containing protein [Rhodanobacter sp. AS-Z3]|uniref:transglycosylase SLT domain-containing protein n=1 Tax=Rhodanobacter sp. AS-Z3 TaxID=3031330 RepID=UPI00247AEFE0|nr:transglycosylase SLT domain-containing protein [Rhodanobacter sp. AS-Z3]WEN15276.1 transglycosylase SLT domain-containing protein [Rhodanobacter sp. AS-Z3]
MLFSASSRRLPLFRLALASVWLLAGSTALATTPDAAQRAAFKQAYAAAQQGGDGWQALAKNLHDYPLYPYLLAAALQHDIEQADRTRVEAYLAQYPDWIPASDLRRAFLQELARRQDWSGFLAMYQPGLGDALSCDALQAHLASGAKLDFQRDLAALWTRASLPSACDPVLTAAHDQGLLTDERLWTRIDRAADASQAGTVASLAEWLPTRDRTTALQLALALRDPAAALADALHWPDGTRQRVAVTEALTRLARRDSNGADTVWRQLKPRFHLNEAQRTKIQQTLALFHATDFDDGALARLIALPAAAQTDSTREWRVRVALAAQNWDAVLEGIQAMPASQQQDGEWQYFLARALAATGHPAESQQQFASQASQPTFYGFLAADQLGQPYAICPLTPADDAQREQQLLAMPGLLRAFELYAVDLPKLARREWTHALRGSDTATQRVAADMANRRGWYDRAVFTLSSGDALRFYALRFPLASQDGLVPQAEQAGIEPSWAYGILRAESAWMSDARSGADARGLMQLLPGTAALVAKRNGLDWAGGDSLYDPATNIALGTRYLAQMAARFNGSPWLASAAYNAGPNKVDQWLAARGTLPTDLFVASIPYKETREYVARVMAFSVIYDWRLNGDSVVPLSTRMDAIGKPYTLPNDSTLRRAVSCPAVGPVVSTAP